MKRELCCLHIHTQSTHCPLYTVTPHPLLCPSSPYTHRRTGIPAVWHGDEVSVCQQFVEQCGARALLSCNQCLALALLPAVTVGCGRRLLQSEHTHIQSHTHTHAHACAHIHTHRVTSVYRHDKQTNSQNYFTVGCRCHLLQFEHTHTHTHPHTHIHISRVTNQNGVSQA